MEKLGILQIINQIERIYCEHRKIGDNAGVDSHKLHKNSIKILPD